MRKMKCLMITRCGLNRNDVMKRLLKIRFFIKIFGFNFVFFGGIMFASQTAPLHNEDLDHLFNNLEETSISETSGDFYSSIYHAAFPEKKEFTCPICKTKTVYDVSDYKENRIALIDSYSDVMYFQNYQLRLKELSGVGIKYGLSISIDMSDFCSKCSKDESSRKFYLVVKYQDGTTIRNILVDSDDLRKITSFLAGETTWRTSMRAQKSLKKEIPLIKKFLGLTPEVLRVLPSQELSPREKEKKSDLDIIEKFLDL